MSDTPTAGQSPKPGFMQRYHFLLRRLHSLSGILPVGVFVIMHLLTNSQMIWGQAEGEYGESVFQHEVDFIHSLPALEIIEITLWLSIGFHAVLGIYYTFSGKQNVKHYAYKDNWRYTLQRITGMIAIVFIFLHIATLRWRWDLFGWFTPFYAHGGMVDGEMVSEHTPMSLPYTAYALQVSWLVVLFYAFGALAVVYHWANGLWTAAISWGITVSEAAMRRWGYACFGLFVVLTAFFAAAIIGARNYDLLEDTTAEQKLVLAAVIEDKELAAELRKKVEEDEAEMFEKLRDVQRMWESE